MAGTERARRKIVLRLSALAGLAIALAATLTAQARAQIGSDRYSSIVIDAASGNVLEAANPDAPRHPASLAKLMTLYLAFEALRDRRITSQQSVPVSSRAAATPPTKLGLSPGMRLTVEEAVPLGLVTKSANDAAAALGELLGGEEDRFAQMMTLRARCGHRAAPLANASGLPDPDAWTTARDLAILARHLQTDFPGFYPVLQHPQLHLPDSRDLQSRPDAAVLSRGRWHEDGLHRGVRAQSRDQRGAQRRSSDRRRVGCQFQPRARRPHGDAARPGFRAVGCPARAPYHRGEPDARSGRNRTCRVAGDPADPSGCNMCTATTWTIQVGSFGSERAAREAASSARRVADGGEMRIRTRQPAPTHDLARTAHRIDGGRSAGNMCGAGAASVGVHRTASGPSGRSPAANLPHCW